MNESESIIASIPDQPINQLIKLFLNLSKYLFYKLIKVTSSSSLKYAIKIIGDTGTKHFEGRYDTFTAFQSLLSG